MIYKLNFSEGVMEFVKNQGRAMLEADSPEQALATTRELFAHVRDEQVEAIDSNRYVVSFQVSLDYKLSLVRSIERAVRIFRQERVYNEARYIERYVVATVFMETGQPEFLADRDIKKEISNLRKAAVVAREVINVIAFIDYDIAIYNYLELNHKEGFRSRVVREVKA